MANSKYEYVRDFEVDDRLLQNTYIVIRIDGRGFHKFCKKYSFEKPNDIKALNLMNTAAHAVMTSIPDLIIAYGISDEFSFVFSKNTTLYSRRSAKLVSTIVSTFTAHYVQLWSTHFPSTPLSPPLPTFDGRAILYPTPANLRDYLAWRQVDAHINNLYNTTFTCLIEREGLSNTAAEEKLKGTSAADKNELLFRNGINYNNEPAIFRKGTVMYHDFEQTEPVVGSRDILESVVSDTEDVAGRAELAAQTARRAVESEAGGLAGEMEERDEAQERTKSRVERERRRTGKAGIRVESTDLISAEFWHRRPWILSGRAGRVKRGEAGAVVGSREER